MFAPHATFAPLLVLVIGLFRYSTLPFEIYSGGEILLQAATPWIILIAYRVPRGNAVRSASVAASAVFLAFLAKLTGLIVIGAALAASGMVELAHRRKITPGMVGGVFGALLALTVIYVSFLAKGSTPASPTNWSLPLDGIAFAVLVPWVAGLSWTDLMAWFFFHPPNPILRGPAMTLWFVVPVAVFFAALVLTWQPDTIEKRKFKLFSLLFYAIVVMTFVLLYIQGASISLDERHFRSVGTLLFVCALTIIMEARAPKWIGGIFLSLCVLMAVYGLASFSSHVLTTANGRSLDRQSWTNQLIVDAAAIDFIGTAYEREGRRAVFVLPSPEIAVTLPTEARVIAIHLDFERESDIANRRYAGRVTGHLFVVMQNDIADTGKGHALLSSFRDYLPDAWERRTFANTTVFFQ